MSLLQYRDNLKPNPHWDEVAIYGGYRWLQFMDFEGIWISRRWESQLAEFTEMLLSQKIPACQMSCFRDFKDMLADNGLLVDYLQSYVNLTDLGTREGILKLATYTKYTQDVIRITDPTQSNINKLRRLLILDEPFVAGYSEEVMKLVNDGKIKRITSSYNSYNCETTLLSEKEIVSNTLNRLVFIPHSKVQLKGDVRNWANVITL